MNQHIFFVLAVLSLSTSVLAQSTRITDLRLNQLSNPLGIDAQSPHFSWKIKSADYDVMQSHYQIIVGTNPNLSSSSIYWDSGKISSKNSTYIVYEGPALKSNQTYYWKVKGYTNKS